MKSHQINPLERDRQRAIYEYLVLKYPRGCWWRSEPAGAFLSGRPRHGRDLVTPGVPDISGVLDGLAIAIEGKRERNQAGEPMSLRPAQFRFKKQFEYAGGRYIVATDIDDVEEAMRPF